MVKDVSLTWPIEEIPDKDTLFMWVNKKVLVQLRVQGDEIPGEIFREHGGALSTFWEKYATPDEARKWAKNPLENGNVRQIPPLQVEHAPDLVRRIRAHTNILGVETKGRKSEIRVKLSRIARWNIKVK